MSDTNFREGYPPLPDVSRSRLSTIFAWLGSRPSWQWLLLVCVLIASGAYVYVERSKIAAFERERWHREDMERERLFREDMRHIEDTFQRELDRIKR